MNIAVIMACHNRKEKTAICLSSLYKQEGLDFRFKLSIFLLDDNSTDGTSDYVSSFFPKVHLINGDGNLYWNRGMYKAWESAYKSNLSFDFYLWLNDDTFLYPNALNILIDSAQQTDFKSIICSSICSTLDDRKMTYGGCKLIGSSSYPNYPNGKLQLCDLINGNCVLIHHSIFLKVGNLDRTFHHAIGDNDYGLRAKKMGILSFSTGYFVGTCHEGHSPDWCNYKLPLIIRFRNLYSPLGNAEPIKYFIYQYRHFGLFRAIFTFISSHIRLLLPQLWQKK